MSQRIKSQNDPGRAPVEIFRQKTAAATRAIARDPELNVEFVPEAAPADGNTLRLAQPAVNLPYEEVSRVRGQADSVALRYRHHDARLHQKLAPVAAEKSPTASPHFSDDDRSLGGFDADGNPVEGSSSPRRRATQPTTPSGPRRTRRSTSLRISPNCRSVGSSASSAGSSNA